MEITGRQIEGIPPGNLRVPRGDFVAVWSAAERSMEELERQGKGDWYLAGVVVTCRWIATAVAPSIQNRMERPWAPVSHRSAAAHEELIEAEYQAAERYWVTRPGGWPGRPGWLEAVQATLAWAWRGSDRPPLRIDRAEAG
jgi:hypothetical protein